MLEYRVPGFHGDDPARIDENVTLLHKSCWRPSEPELSPSVMRSIAGAPARHSRYWLMRLTGVDSGVPMLQLRLDSGVDFDGETGPKSLPLLAPIPTKIPVKPFRKKTGVL